MRQKHPFDSTGSHGEEAEKDPFDTNVTVNGKAVH